MIMNITIDGQDIFIGDNTHCYPSNLGYWVDTQSKRDQMTSSAICVADDFGNLVDVLAAAHQRATFRQTTH